MVRLDKFAFPGDPMSAHGTAFDDVRFEAPLGGLAAWQVDGTSGTWAIFVHGKASDRGEALRMLPVVTRAGLPSLVITYRNDEGVAQDPSAYYQYGTTEWEDLDAAVRHALAQGAQGVVLIGYSMGGAIVVSFLLESPLADRVSGVILDAPMLDFGATIDLAAEDRGLPAFLTWIAKRVTSVRFGIDWGELDYLDEAGELSVPILLFHGDADETVPRSISETLAAERPDLVTYESFEDGPHVGAWNVDPKRYEAAVAEFLETVAR
jgi:pimeloyl-ACP methyl ester carboxylesterase